MSRFMFTVLLLGLFCMVSQISFAENVSKAPAILSFEEMISLNGGCNCYLVGCSLDEWNCTHLGKLCGNGSTIIVYCICTKAPNLAKPFYCMNCPD